MEERNEFKAIFADKKERKEFVGGFAICVACMVLTYISVLIFG